MPKRKNVIDDYGKLGGPLPTRGYGSGASAFWRAYDLGLDQPGLRGGARGSVADQMFRAGLKRRKVEPGLEKH